MKNGDLKIIITPNLNEIATRQEAVKLKRIFQETEASAHNYRKANFKEMSKLQEEERAKRIKRQKEDIDEISFYRTAKYEDEKARRKADIDNEKNNRNNNRNNIGFSGGGGGNGLGRGFSGIVEFGLQAFETISEGLMSVIQTANILKQKEEKMKANFDQQAELVKWSYNNQVDFNKIKALSESSKTDTGTIRTVIDSFLGKKTNYDKSSGDERVKVGDKYYIKKYTDNLFGGLNNWELEKEIIEPKKELGKKNGSKQALTVNDLIEDLTLMSGWSKDGAGDQKRRDYIKKRGYNDNIASDINEMATDFDREAYDISVEANKKSNGTNQSIGKEWQDKVKNAKYLDEVNVNSTSNILYTKDAIKDSAKADEIYREEELRKADTYKSGDFEKSAKTMVALDQAIESLTSGIGTATEEIIKFGKSLASVNGTSYEVKKMYDTVIPQGRTEGSYGTSGAKQIYETMNKPKNVNGQTTTTPTTAVDNNPASATEKKNIPTAKPLVIANSNTKPTETLPADKEKTFLEKMWQKGEQIVKEIMD